MASGKGIGILAVAAAALFALGKKKRDDVPEQQPSDGTISGAPQGPGSIPGVPGGPSDPRTEGIAPEKIPPVPAPPNLWSEFRGKYPAAVNVCFGQLGPSAHSEEVKACALRTIFPDATWPMPLGAYQWQFALWDDPDFNDYVLSQYPPVT